MITACGAVGKCVKTIHMAWHKIFKWNGVDGSDLWWYYHEVTSNQDQGLERFEIQNVPEQGPAAGIIKPL